MLVCDSSREFGRGRVGLRRVHPGRCFDHVFESQDVPAALHTSRTLEEMVDQIDICQPFPRLSGNLRLLGGQLLDKVVGLTRRQPAC